MPFFDFSHLVPVQPNDYSGIRDIFKNFYQGMDFAQTPQRLQAERQNEALKNALLKAQGEQVGLQNQYLPQMNDLALALDKQKLASGAREQEIAEMKMNFLRNALSPSSPYADNNNPMMQHDIIDGDQLNYNIPMRPGYSMKSSNIGQNSQNDDFRRAVLVNEMMGGPKPFVKYDDANGMLYEVVDDLVSGKQYSRALEVGPGIEERERRKAIGQEAGAQEVAAQRASQIRPIGFELPEGAMDLTDPAIDSTTYRQKLDDIRDDSQKAKAGIQLLKIVDKMERINNKYPELWKTFEAAIEKSSEKDGAWATKDYLIRNYALDEEQLAAVQEFAKLSADAVLLMADSTGVGRATNQFREMQAQTKPSYGNAPGANNALFNTIRERYRGYPGWNEALKKGIKYKYYPYPDPDMYQQTLTVSPQQIAIEAKRLGVSYDDVRHTIEQAIRRGKSEQEALQLISQQQRKE